MRLSSPRRRIGLKYVLMSVALVLFCSLEALAQQRELTRTKAEARLTFGVSSFTADDGRIAHGVGGASVRIYVTRRVSLEPEFLYMQNSPDDQDYLSQVSVAYDFGDSSKRIVPYVIAGGGVLHHRGQFFGRDFVTGQPRVFDQSYTAAAVSGGAGVKIFLTKGLFVAPEGRVGWQPSLRATISIGYVFSGRHKR